MLKRLREEQFDECYQTLLQSFPPDELRPYDEQKALLEKSAYQIWVAGEGKIDGLLAVYDWEDCLFIEHFAVRPDLRGQGMGGRFLQALVRRAAKPTYLETELPETEIARRRIGFYERNGFVLNGYDYIQPPISAGRKPVPLRIMSYGNAIDEETYLCVKKKIYAEVYGC